MTHSVTVTRTWLRDGSQNHMRIDDAVENLKRFHGYDAWAIKQRLLAGETLKTRLAEFRIRGPFKWSDRLKR